MSSEAAAVQLLRPSTPNSLAREKISRRLKHCRSVLQQDMPQARRKVEVNAPLGKLEGCLKRICPGKDVLMLSLLQPGEIHHCRDLLDVDLHHLVGYPTAPAPDQVRRFGNVHEPGGSPRSEAG